MDPLTIAVAISTLLVAIVTGLLLGFAILVMPGIRSFADHQYLLTFKSIDRIIQDKQPIFPVLWIGSVISVITAMAIGWGQSTGPQRDLLVFAGGVYLIGVQMPTVLFNVPANNRLHAIDLNALGPVELSQLRQNFEPSWVRWNLVRTIAGFISTSLLLVLVNRP